MEFNLNTIEARVLGSLFEKSVTTPDYYPMTLNALISACNQKSNREPVMDLSEEDVVRALDGLREYRLVALVSTAGSRTLKYAHRMNTFYEFSPQEFGILCVLLLRGPQTPGEIRTRTNRLCSFDSVTETEETLRELEEREGGPFVVQLPRQPGRSACRFMHLLGGPVDIEAFQDTSEVMDLARAASHAGDERITALEEKLSVLEEQMRELQESFRAFKAQFEG
ncbi:MAG: DUF480 domain-containing protein [Spartobacteria bacterium]|nr:DUF480 domain-containing protein [Spartobacteria bacterium]